MKYRSTAVVVAVMLMSAAATTQVVAGAHEANQGVKTADATQASKSTATPTRAHL